MAGEIHGIISREDAWRNWRPYGDRVELNGFIDADAFTNDDALQVVLGADEDTQSRIYDYWHEKKDQRDCIEWLYDIYLQEEPRLIALLITSQVKQQQEVNQKRAEAIDGGLNFVNKLSTATRKLVASGLLSNVQAATIDSWLVAPDGLPYMQYTPMSQLEYARLAFKYDKEDVDLLGTDCTDFSLGILRSAVTSNGHLETETSHNRVHESVHGSLSGVEIYDITREDGWRRPEATVVGAFTYEPTTAIMAGDDLGAVENVEITEGWTDFIARQLIRVEPSLGRVVSKAKGHGPWAKVIKDIHSKSPDVYVAVTDAMLVEATPVTPDAKRVAVREMHEFADRKLGVANSLNQLFIAEGGSILDIYTKGKK